MHLESIGLEEYTRFARQHFEKAGKEVERAVVRTIYERFNGITWYIQKMLNSLYAMTPQGGVCSVAMIDDALRSIVDSMKYAYTETLFRMPERQKELLIAISKAGDAESLTSGGGHFSRNTVFRPQVPYNLQPKDFWKRITSPMNRGNTAFTTSSSAYG